MTDRSIDVCAAGHICLDIIPFIDSRELTPDTLYKPGNLVQVGQATLSLGGSVANTGMALHRLGAKVQAIGKVGDDVIGQPCLYSGILKSPNPLRRQIIRLASLGCVR